MTLSHPAAILPLARRPELPFSALVIGSMLPDFPYFFPFVPYAASTHDLWATLLVDLPLGLLSLWIFHGLVAQPVRYLLPAGLRLALPPEEQRFRFWPLKRLGYVCLALLLGIWSHVLWDSFTHLGGWFVRRLPVLRLHLFDLWGYQVITYKLLQHGGTLVGGALLLVAFTHWYLRRRASTRRSETPAATGYGWLGLLMLLLALSLGLISGLSLAFGSPAPAALAALGRETIVLGGSIWVFEIVVYSLIWQFTSSRQWI